MVGLGNRTFFSGFKYLLHNINFFLRLFTGDEERGWFGGVVGGEHGQLVVVADVDAVADVVGFDGVDGDFVDFFSLFSSWYYLLPWG